MNMSLTLSSPNTTLVAFQLSAPLPKRTAPFPKSQKRLRHSMCTSREKPIRNISRRFLLVNASLAASLLIQPASPATAYSSPYKPGQKSEQNLPERLYESQANRVVTTQSGLQYFDLAVGSGAEAGIGSTVFVYYTSRLRGLNGIKVQSSFDDPSTPPFIFKVGAKDVVPGVNETLVGMRVGGKRRAVLPPGIAYSSPDMRPAVTEFFARRRLLSVLETNRDATIVFDFELVNVK